MTKQDSFVLVLRHKKPLPIGNILPKARLNGFFARFLHTFCKQKLQFCANFSALFPLPNFCKGCQCKIYAKKVKIAIEKTAKMLYNCG